MKSKSRKPTGKEIEFIFKVKRLPCIICKAKAPSQAHHICDTGRRMGHAYILPLCEKCHIGQDGFTGLNRSAWDKSLANQLKLCQQVYMSLNMVMPIPTSKIVGYYERMLET